MSRHDEPTSSPQRRFAGPALYWNAPVVKALDRIETLAGFSPDRVEWDSYRFWSHGSRTTMSRVFIYAYPIATPLHGIRFGVDHDRFTASNRSDGQARELTIREIARHLDVPVDSANQATAELGIALAQALARYNHAHSTDPRARRARSAPRPTASYSPATDRIDARRPDGRWAGRGHPSPGP